MVMTSFMMETSLMIPLVLAFGIRFLGFITPRSGSSRTCGSGLVVKGSLVWAFADMKATKTIKTWCIWKLMQQTLWFLMGLSLKAMASTVDGSYKTMDARSRSKISYLGLFLVRFRRSSIWGDNDYHHRKQGVGGLRQRFGLQRYSVAVLTGLKEIWWFCQWRWWPPLSVLVLVSYLLLLFCFILFVPPCYH